MCLPVAPFANGMMREAVLAEGGKLAARATVSKSPPCENYHSMHVCFPGTTGGGARLGMSPFSFGWVWWVGGSTTGSAGSAHGLRDLFHEASRDTDLLVRARWPLRAQPLQLQNAVYYLYCAWLVKTCRPHFCFFYLFLFSSF